MIDMKKKEIEKVIEIYFPKEKHSEEVLEAARLACWNIERMTRMEAVRKAYDLANALANDCEQVSYASCG